MSAITTIVPWVQRAAPFVVKGAEVLFGLAFPGSKTGSDKFQLVFQVLQALVNNILPNILPNVKFPQVPDLSQTQDGTVGMVKSIIQQVVDDLNKKKELNGVNTDLSNVPPAVQGALAQLTPSAVSSGSQTLTIPPGTPMTFTLKIG